MQFDVSPEQACDLAGEEAYALMRANMLPLIRHRQDAEAIMRLIAGGNELAVDYHPDSRLVAATLIGNKAITFMPGCLADDLAANDLYNVLGRALTTALNAEPESRRHLINTALKNGGLFVTRLRILSSIEALVLAVAFNGQIIWQYEVQATFDEADRLLRPTLQ